MIKNAETYEYIDASTQLITEIEARLRNGSATIDDLRNALIALKYD